jgi:two-component system CheB/CheR fusion protein
MAKNISIVGVGASAGGLEAHSKLFANMPETLATVASFIVAQHPSPNYRSMLTQILSRESVSFVKK